MNSISESYKNNPTPLKYIVPLDYNSVLTIPDSHKWVVEPHTEGSVPLIDLSDPNAKSLIREACEKWGVFQIINHGVPTNLLNEVEIQTFRLFSLPTHQKLCALRLPEGFTGYGMPRTSINRSKFLWAEAFFMMGSPLEHVTQLWPHQPDQQTSFCAVMEEWQKEIKRLTERMMELMLESLGLTSEDVEWFKPTNGCDKTQAIISMNSYPMCPEPDQTMGLGPHTDTSLLNILYQSNCCGLQVLRDGIGWISVQPIPGALVVNVGDMLHLLSNGRFKNVLHRVVVSKTHRISVAYIYGPPNDVKISPLTKLTDHDHPPLYCPVTWKDHIYAKSIHFSNALEIIKNKME